MPTGGLTRPPDLLYNMEVNKWKCVRVVEGTCLENKHGESHRGFESYHFRWYSLGR